MLVAYPPFDTIDGVCKVFVADIFPLYILALQREWCVGDGLLLGLYGLANG